MAEYKKFSVDPQITSLEVLCSLLAKAFDLKAEFGISYKTKDPTGQEQWLLVLSDWDLDAAFLRAHNLSIVTASEPCLNLKVEVKQNGDGWESLQAAKQESLQVVQQQIDAGHKYLMNQVEKTFSIVQKALNFVDEQTYLPPVLPLSDMEFRKYCDSVGQIIHASRLRRVIYEGGIDSSLRRVLWKLLLNVYPERMTGKERMDYMKRKSTEYLKLRDTWREAVQAGNTEGDLGFVTGMVRKDVLRTDRLHPFYAGSDDNQNVAALFNILTTYSLNHPSVSYCQGMSDFCSCILVSMQGDEAQAYICFCALMRRIKPNFMIDGIAMTQKFAHLSEALEFYDAEFYAYLKQHQADDLLFCYRWLLLEMKREFAFNDALLMLEVLWAHMPANPPETELPLFEKEFTVTPPEDLKAESPPKPRENAYTTVCALRRQNSAMSIKNLDKRLNQSLDENAIRQRFTDVESKPLSLDETKVRLLSEPTPVVVADETNPFLVENGNDDEDKPKLVKNFNEFWNLKPGLKFNKSGSNSLDDSTRDSSPDDDYAPMTSSITRELNQKIEDLDREIMTNFGGYSQLTEAAVVQSPSDFDIKTRANSGIFIWENPLHEDLLSPQAATSTSSTFEGIKELTLEEDFGRRHRLDPTNPFYENLTDQMVASCEEAAEPAKTYDGLPPPRQFGGGNPFLMFLCLTLLLQHRETIMSK